MKNFDYEGTWDDVKAWFHKEVKMLEDSLKELEGKIIEWKDKASDIAYDKAEEMSEMIQDRISDVQDKLQGKWDEVNEKYQLEEKVTTLKKHYDQLKKQLSK